MGRGRAKAKQTKVARELKYSSRGTDLDALRAELAGAQRPGSPGSADGAGEPDETADDDPYAAYDLDDDQDDDEREG